MPTVTEPQARPVDGSPSVCCSAACAAALLAASDREDVIAARISAAVAEALADAGIGAQLETAHAEGYAECSADVKAAQHGIVDVLSGWARAEAERWLVACGPCRRRPEGRDPYCKRCELRTRATFADPHPDDTYQGGPVAWVPEVSA